MNSTTITKLQAAIAAANTAKAATLQKVVDHLKALPIPVNTKGNVVGTQLRINATEVAAGTGVNAADLLLFFKDRSIDAALQDTGWHATGKGVGGCHYRDDKNDLSQFEVWHRIGWELSFEDAVSIVLEGAEVITGFWTDDDGADISDEALDAMEANNEAGGAAFGIIQDYLVNKADSWTAQDIKLARFVLLGMSSTEGAYEARDFEPMIEDLSDLATAMLRGLEALLPRSAASTV
jgi:hypothetical protein